MRTRCLAAVLLAAALAATACGEATPAADGAGSGSVSGSASGSGSSTEEEAAGETRVVTHDIHDQLSQIAPTVFTESSGTNWKQGFELVADALGQAEEGQQALAEYDDRVAQRGEDRGASEMTASIVRCLPDQTRIYGPETFSGSILAEHDCAT